MCRVYCLTHNRGCAAKEHQLNAHGQVLHVCTFGRWGGHDFYERAEGKK